MSNFKNSAATKARGIGSIIMSILYFGMAVIIVSLQQKNMLEISKSMAYIASALLAFYAIFRVYRGVNILRNAKNEE